MKTKPLVFRIAALLAWLFLAVAGVAASGDDNWDNRFSPPGVNGEIKAMAVSGTNVYVAGRFTNAGDADALCVARWDGTRWSALGSGIRAQFGSADVYAIAVDGDNVYVGGEFSTAGGVSARNIARWNGSTWTNLTTGVGTSSDAVYALAAAGGNLFVGGYFTVAGGVSARYVAKWTARVGRG